MAIKKPDEATVKYVLECIIAGIVGGSIGLVLGVIGHWLGWLPLHP